MRSVTAACIVRSRPQNRTATLPGSVIVRLDRPSRLPRMSSDRTRESCSAALTPSPYGHPGPVESGGADAAPEMGQNSKDRRSSRGAVLYITPVRRVACMYVPLRHPLVNTSCFLPCTSKEGKGHLKFCIRDPITFAIRSGDLAVPTPTTMIFHMESAHYMLCIVGHLAMSCVEGR